MHQAHVFISGIVQGVGYRYFVKENATKLGLKGWVRNAKDGRVEAVFQGEEKVIEQLIELCKEGPYLAEVNEVVFEWESVKDDFADFSIKIN